MDWLTKYVDKLLLLPAGLSGFIYGVIQALQDGYISDDELHTLIQMASGFEILLLIPIFVWVKQMKNRK